MSIAQEKVAAIGKLMAQKGIPPFLVAANIAEANYESVRLWKEDGAIRVEAVCIDEETAQRQVYLYVYDTGMVLQSIQQTVGAQHAFIWDRHGEIAGLVKEAVAARLVTPSPFVTTPDEAGTLPQLVHP